MDSIGRAGATIAVGTLISRITGLIRSIVLVSAIGSVGSKAADAFGVANQLPNNIYMLISTGVLTAVIVPQIVKASTAADSGRAYISKLFTLGTVVLLVTTAVAMLAAPWLVTLYAPAFNEEQFAMATAFAYWCLPQIFFYGLYSLVGEALNARRIFGPFAWAPIVNNLVSIAGFIALIVLFGSELTDVDQWTGEMVAALGAIATGGIVAQALVLLLFWKKTGLSLRPDFHWRGIGLRKTARLAGWTFLMVLVTQVAALVQTQVATLASGDGVSVFAMQQVWLLFMLPYSLIAVSIGTPFFTQLSEHANAGNTDSVKEDIERSIKVLSLFIAAALAAMVAAAIPASRVFTTNGPDAEALALVLLAYLLALWPMSILFILQRAFYAFGDTRTPFMFTLFQVILVIVSALAAGALFNAGAISAEYLAVGIALGQAIASTCQTVMAAVLIRRKIGSIGARSWMPSLLRLAICAAPAAPAGFGAYLLLSGPEGWMLQSQLMGALGTVVIGIVVLVVYVGMLALLRVPEFAAAGETIRRMLPKRSS